MNSHDARPHHHSADADSTASAATPGGGHVLHQQNHHPPPPPPPARWHPDDPSAPLVRLMCSYGGRILPRPHDNQLRYVGGDTRIVAVPRSASFAALLSRLSKLLPAGGGGGGTSNPQRLKYQLPHEGLDALVSLTSDEDVENMFDEYDRLAPVGGHAPRLRLFLFPPPPAAAFGSAIDQWFVDALNGSGSGPPSLGRGRSDASSIISEVPDYLFGFDTNSEEPPSAKVRARSAASEPGWPFAGSSQLPIFDLPPAKTKADMEEAVEPVKHQQTGLGGKPVWPYVTEPAPILYMHGTVHGGSQPVQLAHSIGPMSGGQASIWFQQSFSGVAVPPAIHSGPVYVGGPAIGPGTTMGRGGYEYPAAVESEAYEAPASLLIPVYQTTAMGIPLAGGGGEEQVVTGGSEMRVGKPGH